MRAPRTLLLIAHGPEARAFLQSGLADRLRKRGDVCIAAWRPDSSALRGEPGVVAAPRVLEPAPLRRVRDACRRRRERRPICDQVERLAARALGGSREWAALLRDLGVETVVTASYSSVRALPALETAVRLGLRTIAVANSWKDAFAKPHAPVPLDAFGFGSEFEVAAFRAANPALAGRSFIAGRPHLAGVTEPGAAPSREAFCRQVGLDPDLPFLCYTAASPVAAPDEPFLVSELLDRLARRLRRAQVLLRLNPMEGRDAAERFRAVAGRPGVVVQQPAWEWDATDDWCCPLPADAELLAGAAEHAAANVSLASTVTLDFVARGTPVVNLCCDRAGRSLWEAPYYAEARRAEWATPAFTPSLAVELLLAAVQGRLRRPTSRPFAALERATALLDGLDCRQSTAARVREAVA